MKRHGKNNGIPEKLLYVALLCFYVAFTLLYVTLRCFALLGVTFVTLRCFALLLRYFTLLYVTFRGYLGSMVLKVFTRIW